MMKSFMICASLRNSNKDKQEWQGVWHVWGEEEIN